MNKKGKNKQLKVMLLVVWILFIIVLGLFGYYFYTKKDDVKSDLDFGTKFSYQTNANQDINALIITYLNALASSDQDILKECVTDPSMFDDMSKIQSQSKVVTSYSNINCYSIDGLDDSSTLVYTVANITIAGVESSPLDMIGPFYVVKEGNHYLINNEKLGDDVNKFISKTSKKKDIQELFETVKKDQDTKADADPALKDFMNRLGN